MADTHPGPSTSSYSIYDRPKRTSSSNDEVRLTAECLCKAHHFTASVPRTSLPLQTTTCHCDSCRHFTGALYTIDAPWAGDPEAIRQSSLAWYDFSDSLKVLFCGTCASPLFWESPKRDPDTGHAIGRKFTVFVGALSHGDGPSPPPKLVEVGRHIFVGDTRDGGASMWMRRMNGETAPPVKRFAERKEGSEELAADGPSVGTTGPSRTESLGEGGGRGREEVPVRCHCGGVDLVFLRGEALREFTATDPDQLPPIVDPVSRKYVAIMDACDSCRVSFGSDFSHWAFVLLRHVGFARDARGEGERQPSGRGPRGLPQTLPALYAAVVSVASSQDGGRDPRLGTLAVYQSSEGVKRYFCSRCSACVFYAAEGKHTDRVDLPVGLLWAEDGARAESCFQWKLGGPMHHREDMVGGWREGWLKAIEAEAEAWRKEREITA